MNPSNNNNNQTTQNSNELLTHLSAAETYQISGDLANAAIENRAILSIALQRYGNIAIEEGDYTNAVKILNDSLTYDNSAPNHLNIAVAYLRQNQFEKAIGEAQKALIIDPNFKEAIYLLGNIFYTKEDYKSALPFLEKSFQIAPNFEVANALGITYLNLKDLERAKLLYDEILLAAKKDDPELHLMFSKNYERTNYPEQAEKELRKALAINPKHPRINFYLGLFILQHAGSERLPEAETAFEEELKLTPNDFFSNFFVGVVAGSLNDHGKAVSYLEKAIKINPQKGESYLFLAQSQLELNYLEEAEKNLRQAVVFEAGAPENDAQSRRTHFLLGRLLVKTGRKEEGEKELKIAAELQKRSLQTARDEINQIYKNVVTEPKNIENPNKVKINLPPERVAEFNRFKAYLSEVLAQSYHNLGVIAVQTGQTEDALTNFASASKWKQDFPGLDRNWGIVSFRAGQFENAIKPLSRHLKTNPNDNLVRRMLGISYYFTKSYPQAVETLKPIEPIITTDAELTYFYGISLIQTKQNQEAAQIFTKLANDSQTKSEALLYAGQGFMMAGDYDRAQKEFGKAIKINPNLEKANYFMGQSLIRLNRYDEAEKAFIGELQINPTDFLSKYHLALTMIERKIEPEKTISLLKEAISLKNDYADAHYQLGKIFLENGETNKAIEQLEIAKNSDSQKDYIHYQLSIAYRKAARKEDADRELQRYQELKAANRKNDSPMGNNENSPK